MPDNPRPSLSEAIQKQAGRLGCLDAISNLTEINAIRLLQQREGYSQCFAKGTDQDWCKRCYWVEACSNYLNKDISPMDKELSYLSKHELEWLKNRLREFNWQKSPSLSTGEVGLQIRSFSNIPSATRKMLVASPKTVVCENLEERSILQAYILHHSCRETGFSYPAAYFRHELEVLFTTDLHSLKGWISEADKFFTGGNLSYYPLVQYIKKEKQVMPKASGRSKAYLEDFILLGLPDGDIMLSDKDFAPILNMELPVLENVDYNTLFKLMSDYPEELCSFRDFLQSKVEEMRTAAVGSEQFVKDCHKIEREIRDHIRKLDSDYKKNKLKAAFSLTGCAIASWTLALYCILQGTSNILTILGPGGIVYTASSAYSDYLVKRLNLKENPVYFLWLLR